MKSPKIHSYPYHFFLAIILIFALGVYFTIKEYNEPKFSIQPVDSVPATNKNTGKVVSVSSNLEKLTSKEWFWVETVIGSSVGIKPYNFSAFKITFNKDLTFSSSSDCNNIGGTYEVFENKIKFKDIVRSEKYCMKSRETDYVEGLINVSEISFNDKNEMILKYKESTNFMRFK
jgi:heat shock protein HslJ